MNRLFFPCRMVLITCVLLTAAAAGGARSFASEPTAAEGQSVEELVRRAGNADSDSERQALLKQLCEIERQTVRCMVATIRRPGRGGDVGNWRHVPDTCARC